MSSIRKRTWKSSGEEKTAWVADYFDQHGKRHIKTFATKKAADAWLVTTRGEVAEGTHTAENASITVAKAAELWIERCELKDREVSTLRQYRQHVVLHITPLLGAKKLAQLSTPMVAEFRDELLRKGSRPMARKVLTSLKSIVKDAQERGLVARNAARDIRIDAMKRENAKLVVGRDIPSKAEAQALLAAAAGRWRPFFVTAIFTGMRASELRGLTWANVDLDRKVLHVRQRANLWGAIGAPKSEAGEREIPMAPMVLNVLREWRLACPKGELGLVFPNGKGRVESHANIWNRGFSPLQMDAGIVANGKPKYGLHALRHFFASWAIEREFTPKKVQELLGHASITMTFDRYGHLFPSLEDDHAKFAAGETALIG